MAEIKKRTASLQVIYQGTDISADISAYLISATYTDNTGQADDLNISLEDSEKLWQESWFPSKGDIVRVSIETNHEGEKRTLNCGTFAVDDVSLGGPPDVVTIKAISSLVTGSMKKEKKSQGFENTTLKNIAAVLAAEHGLTSFYQVSTAISYDRVDQREESDLSLLKRLCDDNDLELKISDEKIIIFEGKDLGQAAPCFSFIRGEVGSTYSFNTKAAEIYRAAEISYQDSEQKELKKYTFVPPDAPSVGEVLKINQRVESYEAAKQIARAKLRRKNKQEVSCDLSMMGDTIVLAGLCGSVRGFGRFDGKYLTKTASHSVDKSGGYSTSFSGHKVLTW